ncbi:MAG: C4-dicarboxylate ABC transporter [Rhizobiales bacterium]|nr:C4-dicarboxylate ABC transporter [Hyphomicrobiales bacterium]
MRMLIRTVAIIAAALSTLTSTSNNLELGFAMRAHAQAIPKSLEEGGTESALKVRRNAWTVGVAGGILSGTYMTFAAELAAVLDDGDNLRILPLVTHGAASNLDDLLYLRGVDVAVTQSDVFEYFQTQRKIAGLQNRIHYIIRLPISEVHILAKRKIRSIEDLRGKKVNFGPAGSASSLTGTIIFQRAGIKVEQTLFDNPLALQKLRSGEIDALIRVIGKPIDFFAKLPAKDDLHLVPIPFTKALSENYVLSEFTKAEYPTLIAEGDAVSTLGVPAVLAVYNWPVRSDRARRVQRMVERMFANWEKFQSPPRHPKWKEVNLAATVPGWTRWGPAEELLLAMRAQQTQATDQGPERGAIRGEAMNTTLTDAERERLFREFQQWQQRPTR